MWVGVSGYGILCTYIHTTAMHLALTKDVNLQLSVIGVFCIFLFKKVS